MISRTLVAATLLGTASAACGAAQVSSPPPTFDQGILNSTWYGAYHRPLEPADPDALTRLEEERQERRNARIARSEDRRDERLARREARQERRDDGERNPAGDGSPDEATTTEVALAQPAPSEPVTSQPASPSLDVSGPSTEAPPELPGVDRGNYDPDIAAEFIRDVYAANETAVAEAETPSIVDIYRFAQSAGTIYHNTRPAIGDLVFYHNTFDRNGDGRDNDWYTHIGLVEDVDGSGTISVLSWVDDRVSRTLMNLEHPDEAELSGDEVNTTLRAPRSDDAAYTQHLASELFAGFGSLLGNRTEVVVIDDWRPGAGDLTASR